MHPPDVKMPIEQLISASTEIKHAAGLIDALDAASTRITTTSRSVRTVWRIWGNGPDLLLIHGGGGSWMHFVRNVDALARHNRVIVPDMPGFGDSDTFPEPHTSKILSKFLFNGLNQISPAGALSVVGFSMGGSIATDLCGRLGPRIRDLILVGCGRGFGVASNDAPQRVRWRHLSDPVARLAAHRENLEKLMLNESAENDPLAVYIHAWNIEHTKLRYDRKGSLLGLDDCLSSMTGAIHAIWGDKDAVMGPYRKQRVDFVRSFQASAHTIFIPGAGHWVQYERADPFNDAVSSLLTEELQFTRRNDFRSGTDCKPLVPAFKRE